MPIKKTVKKSAATRPAGGPRAANTGQRLYDWLVKWPVQFALYVLALAVAGSALIGLTARLQNETLTGAVAVLAVGLSAWFLIWKSIKCAGEENMDRRGFLAVDIGIALVALVYYTLFALFGALVSSDTLLIYQFKLIAYSPMLYYAVLVPFALIAIYVIGLSVFNIIATYKYGRGLGLQRWKLLLSIPFGIGFWGYLAYFIDSPKNASVPVKSKWYGAFIDWIMRAPWHGLAGILLTTMAFVFFTSVSISVLMAASLIAFFVMLWLWGKKNLLAKGSKILPVAAILLNILYIGLLAHSSSDSAAVNEVAATAVEMVSNEQSEHIEVIYQE